MQEGMASFDLAKKGSCFFTKMWEVRHLTHMLVQPRHTIS